MRTLASSDEHGLRARSCKAVRAISDLSPSIVLKWNTLAVDVTVNSLFAKKVQLQALYKRRRQFSQRTGRKARDRLAVDVCPARHLDDRIDCRGRRYGSSPASSPAATAPCQPGGADQPHAAALRQARSPP